MKKSVFAAALACGALATIAADATFAQSLFGRRPLFRRATPWVVVETAPCECAPCAAANATEEAAQPEVKEAEAMKASFSVAEFGKTKEGENVQVFTLTNANGLSAKILDFGGVLYEMNVPDKDGKFGNVSCNSPTIPEYQDVRPYFGSLVGRYGNRIAKGKFTLDGVEYSVPVNNGENALHGGLKGFDQVIWAATPAADENGAS
ncbi:MAG: hypothetical protein IKY61_00140, partial [Thermoguttaceae bacterium]|nr:hypothetical protein [Thermoguttaceae bacterium]